MAVEPPAPPTASALSSQQREWIARAWAEIDGPRLARLVVDLTSVPSPTGEERAVAELASAYLREAGLDAWYQPMDEHRGNAIGRLAGPGDGPTLLLCAPIDTAFTGNADEDCPGVGLELPDQMRPRATIEDGNVVGLGAENPKGFAACVIGAVEAVRRAGVPLRGSVLAGLYGGSMPIDRRPGLPHYSAGLQTGCAYMLQKGVRGDFAVLAKPGYAVAWESAGMCWFRIRVLGKLSYTGVRHVLPYASPIVAAAKVIEGLEAWFPEYTARNTTELVAPQGAIGAIEGGWSYKPAFTPAVCTLYVDLRTAPAADPMDVDAQLGQALAAIQAAHPDVELTRELIVALPGGRTAPTSWIVQSAIRAWEHVEGQPHTPRTHTSGADTSLLRALGVPTVQLGLPPAAKPFAGTFSMEACNVGSMERLVRCLVATIVDTCTRTRAEVGL
jgi:acetylornithine deacetylase/succinyl-diaminopimelate desuccinylase-like protein